MTSTTRSLLLATTLVAGGCRQEPQTPPEPPVTIAAPLTVSGPDSLLGLMRLGMLADGSGLLPGPLQLRAAPSDSADTLVTITRWQDLLAEEIGYEEPAIVVWRTAHPWYLVAAHDSIRGWIRLADSAEVVPIAELLMDRLAYLTAEWDGRVRPNPDLTLPGETVTVQRPHGEASADVHESRLVAGTLWFRVSVHEHSPCEGTTDPRVIASGWVPAYAKAKPTVWYYSRGC